jgi:radical SAM protein with 4Fe4S-binding SPASM domain
VKTTDPPTFVQLEPVGQCNLRCRMCAIQYRPDGPPGPLAFMDFDVFRRVLDELPSVRELHLQGLGEPTMHPRFFEMVSHAASRGISVSTNTNLTLMTKARAERTVASGLDTVHVSIDAATAETFEAIRVRARFDRILANLGHLCDARRAAESRLPRIRLVMVLMRRNLAELPGVIRLAHRYAISTMFVQRLSHDFEESSLPERYRDMRDFVATEMLRDDDAPALEPAFAEARAVARDLGIDLRLPRVRRRIHPPGTPGRKRCDWPWRGLYLAYDGRAMPCCMVSTPDRAELGDVATGGVTAVWNGDAYSDFRSRLDSDSPPEICRSCSLYSGTF